jgi:serine/threonine protein kinase
MIGTRIAGRYDVEAQIGIGGMGVVYRAYDSRLRRHVALKVIAPHLVQQEAARTQFLKEAQALAGLMHPNIVTVFDLCDDDTTQTVFIVMELLRGSSLRHCMSLPGRPAFSEVALPLCRALEAAHAQGFLHRDIKPENVFVCDDGTIKLMDFGLARLLTANSRSQASLVAGTLAYMAPEQLKGEKADFRADLYSLGILFYEYLSGATPFEADNPGAVLMKHLTEAPQPLHDRVPDIAPELEAVIHRLLEKSPEARYASAAALREALERPMADSPLSLARAADTALTPLPASSQSTLPDAPSNDIPTPALPLPTADHRKYGSSIFRQPGGKVKPVFLAGGIACFSTAALLFVGPLSRHFSAANASDSARTVKKDIPAVAVAVLTQQAKPTPLPSAGRKIQSGDPSEIALAQKRASAELDELIRQQEQTRTEVERLEKLVATSETKRKAAEIRAANAEAAAPALRDVSPPIFPRDTLLTVPGIKPFPTIPRMKMPSRQTVQSLPLPPGLPATLVQIASLHPHDGFDFRTRPVTPSPDGTLQVPVHNAQACYVYFYQLQDNKNQAVFLTNSDRRLTAVAQHNAFTNIGLRTIDPIGGPVKLLMLASVKPLFGLPLSFTLPGVPRRASGDVSSDNRFSLLHDYRDRIVTTLQSESVQLDGKILQQDDLIVRLLRTKSTGVGTPPLAGSPVLRKHGRNRTPQTGTTAP